MLADAMPWTTLAHETLAESPESYDETILRALGLDAPSTKQCGEIKPRSLSQGHALPIHLDMYDAITIKKIGRLVKRYLRLSRDFTSDQLPDCSCVEKRPFCFKTFI